MHKIYLQNATNGSFCCISVLEKKKRYYAKFSCNFTFEMNCNTNNLQNNKSKLRPFSFLP